VWPVEEFAARYRDYFACTFAMQIAQAIDEGFEELHVYGLELLLGTKREATLESSCVTYWLGYAEGRGMRVVLAPPVRTPYDGRDEMFGGTRVSPDDPFTLVHPYRYGHEYWKERRWVERYCERWDDLPQAI